MTKMKDEDWKSIKYFKKEEFKCKCKGKWCNGYPSSISKELVLNMDKLREKANRPITITSGLRCNKQNKAVGGINNSLHKTGLACDFYFSGMKKLTVINYLKSLSNYNYAYTNKKNMKYAVHYDVKDVKEKIDYNTGIYTINSNCLRVRVGPGTNYKAKSFSDFNIQTRKQILFLNKNIKLDGYPRGLICAVLQIKNNWGKTNNGWICLDYTKKN